MEQIELLEDEARLLRASIQRNFEAMYTFGDILGKSEEAPDTPWIYEKMTELYDTKRSLRAQLQDIESQIRMLKGVTTPTKNAGVARKYVSVSVNAKRELVFGN